MKNIFGDNEKTTAMLSLCDSVLFKQYPPGGIMCTFNLPLPVALEGQAASPNVSLDVAFPFGDADYPAANLGEAMDIVCDMLIERLQLDAEEMLQSTEMPQSTYDKIKDAIGMYWVPFPKGDDEITIKEEDKELQKKVDSLHRETVQVEIDTKPDTKAKHESWKQRDLDDISTEGAAGETDSEGGDTNGGSAGETEQQG